MFFIEGIRQFIRAYEAGFQFQTVVVSPILLKSRLVEKHVRQLRAGRVRMVCVTPEQFRTISTFERASGIGAIVRQKWTALREADGRRGLTWLVIEHLRSPGNLGTILRTAQASGVGGVIFVGNEMDPFDPAIVRASMDGIFQLTMVRAEFSSLADWLRTHDLRLVGLSPDAPISWTELPISKKLALAIGSERTGLSDRMRELCDLTVSLPMPGGADSLNVATATGIMLYELLRRTHENGIANS